MKTLKSNSTVLGLVLVLALASFVVAAPAGAAPLAASGNAIVVHAQDTNNGQVTVNSVTAAQDGWLLIWNDANGAPDSLLGFAPVHQGTNTSVTADIRTANRNGNDDVTPTLWAMLVADPNANIPFASPDSSITPADGIALVAFGSEAAFAPSPAASAMASQLPTTGGVSSKPSVPTMNKITVHRQDANSGQVMVDSVTATQDGWLMIWRDANGAPGGLIGFAPVHQGTNANIAVDIKTINRHGDDDLTATLWATLAPDPNAMAPYASLNPSITPGESVLTVGFGSTAD